MLLDEFQYWANKYAYVWPDKELIEIQDIGIPIVRLKIRIIGQVITEISPLTEYLLKLINMGYKSTTELSAILGIEEKILTDALAGEVIANRIRMSSNDTQLELTVDGKNVLTDGMSKTPKHRMVEVVFDRISWKLTTWDSRQTFIQKDFERLLSNSLTLKPKNKSTVKLQDIPVLELSKVMRSDTRKARSARLEVLKMEQIITRRHAFVPSKLLIYGDSKGKSEFVIVVDGERSISHEEDLRIKGGLSSLGIKVSSSLVERKPDNVLLEIEEDDGGTVKSFEHRPILLDSLVSTTRRFLLIVPWITRSVIDDDFLRKFEFMLRRGVETTIAFGFHDQSGKHDIRRDDSKVLSNLLKLSKKYNNFNFRWMGENENKAINHSKIFIADDLFIIGSFNWLSFRGDKNLEYRKEDSEKRTKPAVVEKRYQDQMQEVMKISSEMEDKYIPKQQIARHSSSKK